MLKLMLETTITVLEKGIYRICKIAKPTNQQRIDMITSHAYLDKKYGIWKVKPRGSLCQKVRSCLIIEESA